MRNSPQAWADALALLPIGAYEPRWFMRDQHIDPDEAVAIFGPLEAEAAFACHFGTFRLTDEPYDEPVERLAAALYMPASTRNASSPGRRGMCWNLSPRGRTRWPDGADGVTKVG